MTVVWPRFSRQALMVWYRDYLSWVKNYKSSVLLNFGEPFTNLLALGFGLGAYVAKMNGDPFIDYIGPGLLMVTAMNAVTFDMGFEGYDRVHESQLYAGMVGAPLLVSDIIGGEFLWEMTRSLLYGAGFFLVLLVLGLVHSWWALLLPVPLALVGLLFAAPALWVAAAARTHEQLFYYYTLVMTPLFLFSGVFFPIQRLPAPAQDLVRALPLYHAVDLARDLVLGQIRPAAWGDLLWLAGYAALLMMLPGRMLERKLVA
jgi:lipooligosaccharide transport system permease protein